MIWIENHIYNLAGQGSPFEIFEKDVLNYEAQLAAWGDVEHIFVVHYEDLWARRHEISKFLGFEVLLPPRRGRSSKALPNRYNHELFERLSLLEKDLRSKYCVSPRF